MGTNQTASDIRTAIGDIDAGIQELSNVKDLIAMESSRTTSEFDSGQDFSSIINNASNTIDGAIDELKKARESLQGVVSALR